MPAIKKRNAKNIDATAFTLLNMGRLYYEMNHIDSAKIYYEKALAVEKKSAHSQNKREILSELAATVALLQGIADKKEIRILNKINSPLIATGDEEMIKTVIRNLLANALKFTKPKGEIKIDCKSLDNQFEIIISDNGVGMNEEILSKLFKGNLTTRGTQNEKGTGLGLLIVKDFVEKNNGSIRVESEAQKGSHFFVTLPK